MNVDGKLPPGRGCHLENARSGKRASVSRGSRELPSRLVPVGCLRAFGSVRVHNALPGRFKKAKSRVVPNPRPLTRDAALGMFHDSEQSVNVTPVPGRGWCGVRRIAADAAEDVEKDEPGSQQHHLAPRLGHSPLVYQDRNGLRSLQGGPDMRSRPARGGIRRPAGTHRSPLQLVADEKSA